MITVEYIMDLINTEAVYIRFPDLSKAYQRIEADGTDIASSLYAALPEGDVVEKLIEKYFDIIAAQIKDTEKENATVTVEGVSQDCVKHSFVLDNEVLGRIFEAVLTELKDDQDVKDILKRFAEDVGNDGDEAVSDFEEFISDSLEDNKDREDDEYDEEENIPVNVALYLTEDNSFVGMEMSSEDDSFSILFPSNEGKTAFKYQMFEEDYLDFNIVGQLENVDGKLNGELKANLDGKHIVTVKLTDYGADYSDPDNLTASGSVELLFTKDFLDVAIDPWEKENLPEAILELLEKPLTVKVDMDMKNQESKTVASIVSDGKELIKTTANMTTEAPKDITIPTEYYDTDSEKDMEEYSESMNTVKFALSLISKLSKAGVPDEFLADLIA